MTSQGPNEKAFAEALRNAPIPDRDRAGVQLARRYAQLLDAVRGDETELATYQDLGPKYLAALTAIGLTLAGRGVKGGPTNVPAIGGALAELRSAYQN